MWKNLNTLLYRPCPPCSPMGGLGITWEAWCDHWHLLPLLSRLLGLATTPPLDQAVNLKMWPQTAGPTPGQDMHPELQSCSTGLVPSTLDRSWWSDDSILCPVGSRQGTLAEKLYIQRVSNWCNWNNSFMLKRYFMYINKRVNNFKHIYFINYTYTCECICVCILD